MTLQQRNVRLPSLLNRPVLRRSVMQPTGGTENSGEEQFRASGYVVVPGVLSGEEVSRLRKICREYVTVHLDSEMPASHFLSTPELAGIPFRQTIVRVLRTILGDGFTIYPNYRMAANLFTDWHLDNNYRPDFQRTDDAFVHSKAFRHAQCIIYLQDNDRILGGGLDVVPGSHRFWGLSRTTPYRILNRCFNVLRRPVSLATKAGDLVVFDIRLLHRGTQAREGVERTKYFISWSNSRTSDEHLSRFMFYYFQRRELLMRLDHRSAFHTAMLTKYDDLLGLKYPQDYPEEVVQLVRAQGINVEWARGPCAI